jgi:hypothetical protein
MYVSGIVVMRRGLSGKTRFEKERGESTGAKYEESKCVARDVYVGGISRPLRDFS